METTKNFKYMKLILLIRLREKAFYYKIAGSTKKGKKEEGKMLFSPFKKVTLDDKFKKASLGQQWNPAHE